jgi:2-polyprenyl-6-methoxyphenol hydroxylase-like FAD-dependent oxidoreductase
MYMIPKGFILFFPNGRNGPLPHHRNFTGSERDNEYTFADIEPTIVEQVISPVTFNELNWFSTYRVHSRMANSFMDGRCFIAGDAGHIHTPAGGQGMNTGIQDAYNLAWKIALTLKGEVNDEVLKTYNTERTQNAKHLLQTTDQDVRYHVRHKPFLERHPSCIFSFVFLSAISKSRFARTKCFPIAIADRHCLSRVVS